MRRLAPFLVVAVLAGCGQPSQQAQFDKALVDAEIATLELAIANDIYYDSKRFPRAALPDVTREYIATTRKLSGKEAKRHLADTATQVQDYCASCAAAMDRERETR